MCTLTYLPERDGFAMMSSRDERRDRGPMAKPVHNDELRALYPVDERTGGTWILTSAAGFSLNLLNGGHERHNPDGGYRHSRGLIPLRFAQAGGLAAFLRAFDPEGLEPFTLVVVGHAERALASIVWTGRALERFDHDAGRPHIWSSSTLYDATMKAERGAWFDEAIGRDDDRPSMARLLDFHLHGGLGRAPASHTIRMVRPDGPETVCITGIHCSATDWTMCFHDLVSDTQRSVRMIG